jgi:hypothetical protein
MEKNGRTISVVLCFVFGAFFLVIGSWDRKTVGTVLGVERARLREPSSRLPLAAVDPPTIVWISRDRPCRVRGCWAESIHAEDNVIGLTVLAAVVFGFSLVSCRLKGSVLQPPSVEAGTNDSLSVPFVALVLALAVAGEELW